MATIRYLVYDVGEAIRFYVDRLGFTLVQQMGTAFAVVGRDDVSLWLSGPRTSAALPMPDGRSPEPGGWNRIVLEVEGIQDVVAALRASGSTFRNDLITGPGGTQILVEDPSGNAIELFEPA